jgi:hypothetical protein
MFRTRWRFEQALAQPVLGGYPRLRFGIVGAFQPAEGIWNSDAVEHVDQIGAGSCRVLHP